MVHFYSFKIGFLIFRRIRIWRKKWGQLTLKAKLIFDLDDTLIPSESIYANAYEKIGVASQTSFQFAKKDVKNRLPSGHVSSHNRMLYFKRVLEISNDFSPQKLILMHNEYEQELIRLTLDFVKDNGLVGKLAKLKQVADLYILTNENTRTQIKKLAAIDPDGSLFKKIFTSEEIGIEKPSPKVFEWVQNEVSDLPETSFWMIGNDDRIDLETPSKMGWNTVLLSPFKEATGSHFKYQITDLEMLGGLLEKSN